MGKKRVPEEFIGKTTDEWHTDDVRVHTTDIRMTYEWVHTGDIWITCECMQMTCGWHMITYRWHRDDKPGYMSDTYITSYDI